MLDQPTEEQLDRGTRTVAELRDSIAFEGVGFSYGDEPVLRDVSFVARRGEVVALVGASGSGKSTLVDLIPRFYEPTSGVIRLDGVDTREITLASLRGLTGIVSQDTVLFNDTVRSNIAYGAVGRFTDEQIAAAARAANAHGFISELPQGYDTVLGERGFSLSGGQRQRIAIARAIVADPSVLILDDATSAVDPSKEHEIREAMGGVMRGRTTIVIAHRAGTIAMADRVVLIDDGKVVADGTHDHLLGTDPRYRAVLAASERENEQQGTADPDHVLVDDR